MAVLLTLTTGNNTGFVDDFFDDAFVKVVFFVPLFAEIFVKELRTCTVDVVMLEKHKWKR